MGKIFWREVLRLFGASAAKGPAGACVELLALLDPSRSVVVEAPLRFLSAEGVKEKERTKFLLGARHAASCPVGARTNKRAPLPPPPPCTMLERDPRAGAPGGRKLCKSGPDLRSAPNGRVGCQ